MTLAFGLYHASAQVISYEDFKTIIPSLQSEDFKEAFLKTDKLLKSTKNDTSDLRGIVTYIDIWSSAGLVSLGQMKYEEFEKNAKQYIGQLLVMPGHPCVDSSKFTANALTFISKNGALIGMTTSANHKGTTILCFEYFKFHDTIDPAGYIGTNVRTGGILKSIEINPNRSTVWISRLNVEEAFVRAL